MNRTTPKDIVEKYITRRGTMHWQDVLSHINAELSCTRDYQGRFLFELLQNAVDRAERDIRVHLDTESAVLYFANDGQRFSIRECVDTDERLCDFHAMCSINTSSKKASESIGNKGVGIKSVWEVAEALQLHSVGEDGQWWGFELRNPLKVEFVENERHTAPVLASLAAFCEKAKSLDGNRPKHPVLRKSA